MTFEPAARKPDVPRRLLAAIAIAATITNALCLAGSRLWVYPDSVDYIQLGGGLADHLDLSNELFLVRTPGYPFLLAVVFRVFGTASPVAILVLQHVMAVATAVLGAAIAWHLTYRRSIGVLAGLMCACSLQIMSYANLVLTEIPYALMLIACVYFLVRYIRDPQPRRLGFASLLAGVSYLLRPVGLHLMGACLAALALVVFHLRRQAPCAASGGFTLRRTLLHGAAAVLPALIVVAPWTLANAVVNSGVETARCLDYVLYLRAVNFDGLDSDTSTAMRDIHEVVNEAKRRGIIAPSASHKDRGTVIKAFRAVRGATFSECSAVLGAAGRDLMRENAGQIALGTARYSVWMLLSADPVYRFQPGGAAGSKGKRDASAEMYDIATYSRGPGSWEHVLRNYERYLPLQTGPRRASPLWTGICRWYYRHVDTGAPLFGLLASPYEQFVALCGVGLLMSLCLRDRAVWLLIALVVALQVVVSAALGGPQTRYALPVKPLMLIYLALAVTMSFRIVVACGRRVVWSARRKGSSSVPPAIDTERTVPAGS